MVKFSAIEVIKGIWRLNYWFRDRESFLTSDETESINLVREYRIISTHFLRGQNLEEYPVLSKDFLLTRWSTQQPKKVITLNSFMHEIMSKILKKFVCENGDCRSNEFKIGPVISLIEVNIIIADL